MGRGDRIMIRETKPKPTANVCSKPAEDKQEKLNLPQPNPLPDYDSRFKPIVEYIHTCEPSKEWPIVEAWLRKSPRDVNGALELLNQQPDMLVRAMRLFLLAKGEYIRFEIDWKDRTEILRSLAREAWELAKKDGMKKQITNDMVEDWIIANYGETYREMKMRLQDMKNTRDLLEKLSQQVEAREPSLRRIVERMDYKKAPAFLTPKTSGGKR